MISEPELLDDGGGPRRHAVPDGVPCAAGPDRSEEGAPAAGWAGPRYRRSWSGVLCGALGASVLWAAGLTAYQTRGADLGDYRTPDALCAEAPLSALVTALGKRGATTTADTYEHPALDRAYCSVQLGEAPAGYEASLRYELHKKTDPAPEFEAVQGVAAMPEEPGPEPVPGLGDKAYFSVSGGTYAEIVVLDGPAVIGLSVGTLHEYADGSDEPTHAPLDGVKEFMVEDVREIMERLRSPAPPGPAGTRSPGGG
ncbi:hypothetical protein M4914_13750 [Streptomyces somaliensis DSM 40738]|uniref:Uncharacterized protein n=1 Tax=Streptomyces somaliensis (strain ATCC 33201 / DSM 40738 / JCM 12659 / KCTC 9044 / NCTC 11332 / NRRL B-12077 / IP 733) TaxID=1134445 RepID=A0AA44DHB4_STRE0|nr:hypothetical protein [Streptomyces somaliensis]MCQ0023910.1 hypothetical protein [Streptomyces somaliensis DSM 40738]NKY16287.1 hypothetical protein [Streptomyces somaliensis DSM 40738]